MTLIVVTGCEGPSTMVRNPTKAVLSRKQVCHATRTMRGGGSQKVTNDDEGEGHCYTMGPLLGTWVPMGTFLGIWVPFFMI